MIRIILVEPEGEENLGGIARAMMNMNTECLILVNPRCDPVSEKCLNYAVHAGEILKSARIVNSLNRALEGSDVSVAFSRRIGQWRKRDFYSDQIGEFLIARQHQTVSLVFGREDRGLENDEVLMCDLICTIPSSEQFPSLNLAQAVMIGLYEINLAFHKESRVSPVADRSGYEAMLNQIISALDELGFFKNVPEWRLKNYLNKLLLRANPDQNDVNAIRNIFNRIEGIVKRLKK